MVVPMNFDWFRFLMSELHYVKSWDTALNLYHKSPFFFRRITGTTCGSTSLPLSLQIELTNHCNIRCTCCPRENLHRPKGFMDLHLFRKIIGEAAGLGIKRAHLYLHGEPLLHPHLIPMIEFVKEKGMGVSLATNGMLLDRPTAEAILAAGVNNADHVRFSLLGHSKQVHEKIMRGVLHEKVMVNILNFIELRNARGGCGPLVETVMYNMADNSHEGQDYTRFWQGVADHVRWVDKVSEQYSSYQKEGSAVPGRTRTCKYLWQRLTILWNGEVTTCCADLNGTQVFGNLREGSIAAQWKHDKLELLRRVHKEKRFDKVPLCATCDWE